MPSIRLRATDEMRTALERCRSLQCTRVAMSPLGIALDDLPRHAAALVEGMREAWQEAEQALQLRFCVPRAEIPGVLKAFETAGRAAAVESFTVSVAEPDRGLR
jgi:hypothetical protein